jgi:hypothetical protein
VVNRPCPKLAMKYFGPYKILEKVGTSAHKLDLPDSSQVHPVFHVSQLKPYTAQYTPVFNTLPVVPHLDVAELEPEVILERRLVKKGNAAITQVLVKWSQLPTEMATWEDYYVLQQWYPEASVWSPAASQGGSNVASAGTNVTSSSVAQ